MDRNFENITPIDREDPMAFDPNIGRGTQWRKGTSENPGGRPRSRLLSEALRTRLAEVKPGDPAGGWKPITAG